MVSFAKPLPLEGSLEESVAPLTFIAHRCFESLRFWTERIKDSLDRVFKYLIHLISFRSIDGLTPAFAKEAVADASRSFV